MNNLIVKEVEFNNDLLMAAQDEKGKKIYVGISWVCNGIGFSKGQKDRQTENIQQDIVLNRGCRKFGAGVFDPNNETLALELDFLPLWLAKINITPSMQKEKPELVRNLVEYQLKAKDVLAEAFIHKSATLKRRKPIDIVFRQNMNIAKTLVEHTGVKQGIAYATAFKRTEEQTGEDLTEYRNLLPPADHKIGTMNATAVGKKLGLTARKANILLLELGLQYKDDYNEWRLTESGKPYGEECPYDKNGHSSYQVRWNESLLDYISCIDSKSNSTGVIHLQLS